MKKSISFIIISVIFTVIMCIICYNAGKSHAFKANHDYFYTTEALLDSINEWEPSFMDNIMETDAYYEYELSREALL